MVKNDIDFIIWLKLDKTFFQLDADIYLSFIYIAPENSPVHELYNVDAFDKLETDIDYFQDYGNVYVFGDLNSRTGHKHDFVNNDLNMDVLSNSDVDLCIPRYSSDRKSNRFGEKLLDLCKSTGLVICNGRLGQDENTGKMTCYTYNGESVVNYLLAKYSNFSQIMNFCVQDYGPYSNHAPVSFDIKINTALPNTHTKGTNSYYRWDNMSSNLFLDDISSGIEQLCSDLNSCKERNLDTDDMVKIFTEYLDSYEVNISRKLVINRNVHIFPMLEAQIKNGSTIAVNANMKDTSIA